MAVVSVPAGRSVRWPGLAESGKARLTTRAADARRYLSFGELDPIGGFGSPSAGSKLLRRIYCG